MSDLELEDRLTDSLRRGAGATPLPSGAVRQSIRRRSHVLRRRHTAVRVASVATATSLVAGVGVWIRAESRTDPVSTEDDAAAGRSTWADPPPGDGTLPTFAIDGYTLTPGTGSEGEEGGASSQEPGLTTKTYRVPDDFVAPVVGVERKSCADTCADFANDLPDPAQADQTTVNGQPAQLWEVGSVSRILSWTLADGSRMLVSAHSLTADEALQFAEGLEPDSGGSFTATVLPRGLAEDTHEEPYYMEVPRRIDFFDKGDFQVDGIRVSLMPMEGDGGLIEEPTGTFRDGMYVDVLEEVTVLGRPAVLIHHDDHGIQVADPRLDPYWDLLWRHTDDTVVQIRVDGIDRAEMDAIIAGLSET